MGQAVAFASLSDSWRGAQPPDSALYRSWRTALETVRPVDTAASP
jgi:hypothetical protein